MSSKARAGVIPTAEYRCKCGGRRHKCDIERIAGLEAEVARLKEDVKNISQQRSDALAWAATNIETAEAKLRAVGELPRYKCIGSGMDQCPTGAWVRSAAIYALLKKEKQDG